MQRDKIKPILFSIIKHSSKEELRRQIPKDVVSGVVVAVVAWSAIGLDYSGLATFNPSLALEALRG